MAEKLNLPERGKDNKEALEQTGAERRVELSKELERNAAERGPEADVDKLKTAAEKAAAKKERKAEKAPARASAKRDSPTQRKAKAKASYKKTMAEAQAHMKPGEKAFSKVIHAPVVEKTSEALGSTVARPNAILAGSIAAFLFTLGLYLFARYYGYPLKGSETIAAFILGWLVGLLFDYLRVMITGRRA